MRMTVILLLLLLAVRSSGFAVTQPDISAIGDFRAFSGNYVDADGVQTARNGILNMRFNELELAFTGYLNPYARADVYVANHGDGFEIEEAYGSILRGLPLNAQLKAGRYLVDFGKLNSYHPHAFPFVDRPIAHRMMFGFDGFADEGVNLSFLLPTGFYSKLSLNALRGKLFEPDAHAHEAEAHVDDPAAKVAHEEGLVEGRNSEDPIFTGRLSFFIPIGQNGNLEFGGSGLYGLYAAAGAEGSGSDLAGFDDMYAAMFAFDLKYKHRWSDYTSLTLQGEVIGSRRDIFSEDTTLLAGGEFGEVTTYGGFAFADFRFFKRYNLGVMLDHAPGIFDGGGHDYNPVEELNNTSAGIFDDQNSTMAITLFTGFSLMEETTIFRLFGRMTTYDIKDPSKLVNTSLTSKDDEFTVGVQLLWSLGPHKPHEF